MGDRVDVRHMLLALISLCVLSTSRVYAQSRPLPYWQHSQWVGEDSPPVAGQWDLARSADGYLWIGATNALIRFDGLRYTVFDSTNTPAFKGLPPGGLTPKLLDSHGRLWIGGPEDFVFTYANGVMKTVFGRGSGASSTIIEDGGGRLWMNARRGVQRIQDERMVAAELPSGVPDGPYFGIARDTSDGLWIGTERDGLWHVQRNHAVRYGTGQIRVLLQSRDGIVWALGSGLGGANDLWQLIDGRWSEVHPPGEPSRSVLTRIAAEGADGSVWFITADMGLLRWHSGGMERYSTSDGLSNDRVRFVFADSEGAIWASTDAGLDRLRPSTFALIGKQNGLPSTGSAFAEDASGAFWIALGRHSYWLDSGIIRNRPGAIRSERVPLDGRTSLHLISPSRRGGAWMGDFSGGVFRLTAKGVADRVKEGFPENRIGIAFETRDGSLWTKSLIGDLGRVHDGKYKAFPMSRTDRPALRGFAEDALGRTWFVSPEHVATVLIGDSIVSRMMLPERGGLVTAAAAEGGDTMWVSTHSTLIRIISNRATDVELPQLDRVLSPPASMVISGGFVWLASIGGIARVPLSELHRAADRGTLVSSVERFGALDGLTAAHTSTDLPAPMRVGRDGLVWIATPDGLAVADPAFRMTTKHARRIFIEDFAVGENALEARNGQRIAARPSRISFRFSMPSLLLAERTRMQYRMDGADDNWIEATLPRVATYNQLRAGTYVFRVRGWDETGKQVPGEATLTFRVLPAWYESWWFMLLVGSSAAGALYVMYRLRMRQITHAYRLRLEERSAERTRIARELHDTLLQSFQGLMFRFQAVREMLPNHSVEAIPILDTALLKGEQAIDQARAAVSDLRASETVERDFEVGLMKVAAETAHVCKFETTPRWTVEIGGSAREIPSIVLYELYQATQEALCNAFQHARATHVAIDVRYAMESLRITVADDGTGFDESRLQSQSHPNHFGIQGMTERMAKLGGAAVVKSTLGEGTRVVLTVPAAVAYRKSSAAKH